MEPQPPESALWFSTFQGDLSRVRAFVLAGHQLDLNWMNPETTSTAFFCACIQGHTEIVKFFLGLPSDSSGTPSTLQNVRYGEEGRRSGSLGGESRRVTLDVMKPNRHGATPFLAACEAGHVEIVRLLMDDPRIDVNKANVRGESPFLLACYHGGSDLVQAMVDDPRVDLNAPTTLQATPLWVAAQEGHLAVVGLLLASGRPIETEVKTVDGFNYWSEMTAKQWATFLGHPEISRLLENFQEDPRKAKEELWVQLKLQSSLASELFALVVLLCDGYLRLGPEAGRKQKRFFKIAQALPLDLQMVLCSRTFRSERAVISPTDTTQALKKVLRKFALEEAGTAFARSSSSSAGTSRGCVIL